MEQIRLTIVTELYMREMGVRQFYETIGGTSYASVRRHFLKLAEYGWLREVRTATVGGRGRPEALYRSTELAVIDTETERMIPRSIRDAITVQLLAEMGGRVGEALAKGTADATEGLSVFRTIEVDELGWCKTYDAVERCFRALMLEQTDAKIRLRDSAEQPVLMVVNLAAFEAPGPALDSVTSLPRAETSSPPPWPLRVGTVFADRLDLEIVDELNRGARTPAELEATHGLASGQTYHQYLRRCKRLTDLGWAVNIGTAGGPLPGATVYRFRAAAPSVSESDIYRQTPPPVRKGQTWKAFEPFIQTSIGAVGAGTFNSRVDRHLTMSPLQLDGVGCEKVTKALREYENTLNGVEEEVAKRRRHRTFSGFRGAYFISSFRAPQRALGR